LPEVFEMTIEETISRIAVPRPSYSEAFDKTVAFIKNELASNSVQFTLQDFALKARLDFIVGITIALLGILLCILIIKKKHAAAVLTAILIPVVLILELEFFVSTVSWISSKPAQNIIISFPRPDAARELIFAAHIDSKTALFDHEQRAYIYNLVPVAVVLGILAPIIFGLIRRYGRKNSKAVKTASSATAVVLAVYWLLFGMSFFGYVFVSDKSPGAVDDAASVGILMELAKDISSGKVKSADSSITIVLTSGEELNLLGAHEYVKKYLPHGNSNRKIPAMLINLDLAGQSGNLAWAEKNGVFLKHYSADLKIADEIGRAWKAVSGKDMEKGESSTDDAVCFMAKGIPSITIYNTGIPGTGLGGFHSSADNLSRIDWQNVNLTLRTLEQLIESKN